MTGRGRLKDMNLRELLLWKMVDYGYSGCSEMARDMGVSPTTMCDIMRGEYGPGLKLRRAFVDKLDIAPEVLERVLRRC